MPFEIKYSHETLLKDKGINEADLPGSIRDAVESFNAVKATVSKKSNEVRKVLTKELKLQSDEIAETIKEWQENPSLFAAPDASPSAPEGNTSPSLETGGPAGPHAPAAPVSQPAAPTAPSSSPEPKKKSGTLMKIALWGLFGILAITVGPEMVNNTKEWLRQRKK